MPPEIVSIVDTDVDIGVDEKRALEIETVGVDDRATFEISGNDVDVKAYRTRSGGVVRLHLQAGAKPEGGLRDLTVTNSDGLADTYADAIFVTGNTEPPELGDLTITSLRSRRSRR